MIKFNRARLFIKFGWRPGVNRQQIGTQINNRTGYNKRTVKNWTQTYRLFCLLIRMFQLNEIYKKWKSYSRAARSKTSKGLHFKYQQISIERTLWNRVRIHKHIGENKRTGPNKENTGGFRKTCTYVIRDPRVDKCLHLNLHDFSIRT